MLRVIFAVVSLMVTASSFGASLPEPKVVKLNDRVYALIGPEELPNSTNRGFVGNSTVIVGKEGAILVDTGFTHELGVHLRKIAERLSKKPVTHLINTHSHGDHFLGNSAFPGTEIISSEKCKEIVSTEGENAVALVERMTGLKFPDTKPVPATRTFAEGTKTDVEIQGVKMRLWVPKGSHTPGDLVVYLPDDRVLIAGDIAANGVVPNMRNGNVKNWLGTLDEAQQLDYESAVPGHGQVMSKSDVQAMAARMSRLYADVEAGYEEGLSDSEIRAKMDLSEWEKLKRFDEMGGNINHVYLEVEAASFQ